MDKGLKTKVDEKFIGGRPSIEKKLTTGHPSTYKITKNSIPYIIRSYQIFIEYLKPGDLNSKQRFIKTLNCIIEAYSEYNHSLIASLFSNHFPRPFGIDYETEIAQDTSSLSYLYIEMVYEYTGEPINKFSNIGIDLIYNLMRQSAGALAVLHNMEIAHLNLNPKNLLYNESTDLLHIKGFETACSVNYCKGDNKNLQEYSPPEVLKVKRLRDKMSLTGIDVYSWAMCFYSLLLNKNQTELANEAEVYKSGSESDYGNFVKGMVTSLEEIKTKDTKEMQKKEIIGEQLQKALNFKADKRPTMKDILTQIQTFEQQNTIDIPYLNIEIKRKKKLAQRNRVLIAIIERKLKLVYYVNILCVRIGLLIIDWTVNNLLICFVKDKLYKYTVFCFVCKSSNKIGKFCWVVDANGHK